MASSKSSALLLVLQNIIARNGFVLSSSSNKASCFHLSEEVMIL
jgi:hypothetical protein